MRRSTLVRLMLVLALTAGLFVGLAPGLQAVTGGTPTSCPSVSCLTQEGYDKCTGAGCGCDPRNDWCVPKATPTPTTPGCPSTCMPESAYNACKECGGSCGTRDECIPPSPTPSGTATPYTY
ncbi:MAG TPA: hypothetical protein VEL74_14910 [Thermoanaerobaculia bacterium]|nr:hypothetical protein [Thermoanaerobaculia bacterium]